MLLIVADGAVSDAVKTIMPPNISKLLEHAKYSWNAYGDANTTDGAPGLVLPRVRLVPPTGW
ncbi:hypothetical protein LWM68_17690 [Niabella sp. W65]|nr:hypothetical protein [Niabella sp. W65]MCH7364420.1 hypothetical protein [Niabella sp. W65]